MGKVVASVVLLVALGGAAFLLLRSRQEERSDAIDRSVSPTPAPAPREGDAAAPREKDAAAPRDGDAAAPRKDAAPSRPGDAPVLTGAASKPKPTETIVDGVEVTGRVVDDRRRPVAGATVDVRVRTRPPATTRTGADGRFSARVGARPAEGSLTVALFAREGSRAGTATAPSLSSRSRDTVDAGTLALRPAHPLDVRATHGGSPVAGATISLGGGQFSAIHVHATTGADGKAAFPAVPPGTWRVFATAEGLGRAVADVAIPLSEAGTVELALPDEHVIAVTVVEAGSGKPIAGAQVQVMETVTRGGVVRSTDYAPPPVVPPTDAEGRTRLGGLGEETVVLVARVPGRPPPMPFAVGSGTVTLRKDATEARIEVAGGRTVRWKVVAGDSPVPADGTEIAFRETVGPMGPWVPAPGRMAGEDLVVDEVPREMFFQSTAVASDGSLATLSAPPNEERGKEISFRQPRRVEVEIRNADGTPASGWVSARSPANLAISDVVALDAEGRAVLSVQQSGRADVFLGPTPQGWGGTRVGPIEAGPSVARVTGTLDPDLELVVRLTVDGERRLPAEFQVGAGDPGMPGGGALRVDEFPEAGELRIRVRRSASGAPIPVSVQAAGYLPASGTARPPEPLDLALLSGGRILVHLLPPKDGQFSVSIDSWDAASGQWQSGPYGGPQSQAPVVPPSGGDVPLGPLAPGRYRVIDRSSGTPGPEVQVVAGPKPAEVRFDLSSVAVVEGRIEAPAGENLEQAAVVVDGVESIPFGPVPKGRRVQKDGRFSLRLPGDRPITLTAWHSLLTPATEGGSVSFTRLPKEVVLKLVPGTAGVLRFDPAPSPLGFGAQLRVLLFRGEPVGTPASAHPLLPADGAYRFGGFASGSYTAWIDVPGLAPAVLKDVALGAGTTDLGTVRMEKGSSIRVRVLVKEGQPLPMVSISASRSAEPAYQRGVSGGGQAEVVLPGLGAGSFRVKVWSMGVVGSKAPIDETVEVDGVTDREMTLDLR